MSRLPTPYTFCLLFFFSSRRRHTRLSCDWSSDVCSSDLDPGHDPAAEQARDLGLHGGVHLGARSEERRGGKEGRSRGAPDHLKKKEVKEHVYADGGWWYVGVIGSRRRW